VLTIRAITGKEEKPIQEEVQVESNMGPCEEEFEEEKDETLKN
jgi:hypothetical protein